MKSRARWVIRSGIDGTKRVILSVLAKDLRDLREAGRSFAGTLRMTGCV
jgi:hypothetical protein